MGRPKLDLIGEVFDRLTVISLHHERPTNTPGKFTRHWLCQCVCGKTAIVKRGHLTTFHTTSCGCYRDEQNRIAHTTHGDTDNPLHKTWERMMARCYTPTANNFKYWGGRGIKVCNRWHKYENFRDDVPEQPIGDYIFDRIDNDKNYEPGNIRWATPKESANNRRPAGSCV